MHLDPDAVELARRPRPAAAGRPSPAPSATSGALEASIGRTGRPTSSPNAASASAPPVERGRGDRHASTPASIAARRTAGERDARPRRRPPPAAARRARPGARSPVTRPRSSACSSAVARAEQRVEQSPSARPANPAPATPAIVSKAACDLGDRQRRLRGRGSGRSVNAAPADAGAALAQRAGRGTWRSRAPRRAAASRQARGEGGDLGLARAGRPRRLSNVVTRSVSSTGPFNPEPPTAQDTSTCTWSRCSRIAATGRERPACVRGVVAPPLERAARGPDPAVEDHGRDPEPPGVRDEVLRDRPARAAGSARSPDARRRRPRGPRSGPSPGMWPDDTPPGAKPPTFCLPKTRSSSRRASRARGTSPLGVSRVEPGAASVACVHVRAAGARPARADATRRRSASRQLGVESRGRRRGRPAPAYDARRGARRGGRLCAAEPHLTLAHGHRAVRSTGEQATHVGVEHQEACGAEQRGPARRRPAPPSARARHQSPDRTKSGPAPRVAP